MLCCLGLFSGSAIGSFLGGPWTLIAPAMGLGLGLVGDMKLMHSMHGSHRGSGTQCCGGRHKDQEEVEKDTSMSSARTQSSPEDKYDSNA